MSDRAGLEVSDRPLCEQHDALILDLDGVVQLDDVAVPYAVDALAELRARGVPQTFLTNNAARPATEVAERLNALGVTADPRQVLTSAMVAADLLRSRLPAGSAVLVVGGPGLVAAVEAAGLQPVDVATPDVAAVVQGWGPDVGWRLLAEGAVALRGGAAWVATNADRTLPSPRGPLPGNGSLVAALRTATGLEPEVVGKPQPAVFETASERSGGRAPLVVGDRLDTDIAGARAAGLPALLVLTGVSTPRDLLSAPEEARPAYVGADLRALLRPHPGTRLHGDSARCGQVTVTAEGRVETPAEAGGDAGADGLRAACALAWSGVLPESCFDDVLRQLDLSSSWNLSGAEQ